MNRVLRWLLPLILLIVTLNARGAGISFGGFGMGGSDGDEGVSLDIGRMFQTAKDAKQSFSDVSPEQEQAIGRDAASILLGASPLLEDNTQQAYVNRVGAWLARHSERPDLKWRFAILDTDSVNAFAAPAGYIFITRGLMEHLNSESELAGVLAHEISHVIRQHHILAIRKGARQRLAGDILALAANRSEVDLVLDGLKTVYARGLDKDFEFESDHMGVVIAVRAGYDPYGLLAVLQTLDSLNADDGNLSLWLNTHPAAHDRVQRLGQLMQDGKLQVPQNTFQGTERFLQHVGNAP
jgi:predicted Zn-dependent protease